METDISQEQREFLEKVHRLCRFKESPGHEEFQAAVQECLMQTVEASLAAEGTALYRLQGKVAAFREVMGLIDHAAGQAASISQELRRRDEAAARAQERLRQHSDERQSRSAYHALQ